MIPFHIPYTSAAAAAAITVIGPIEGTHNSGALTMDFSSLSPQQNDIMLAIQNRPDNSDLTQTVTSPSGCTIELDAYRSDTRDPNLGVITKRMGATPDTSITLPACSSGTRQGTGQVWLLRGVNTTTMLDVASPTHASGVDGGNADAPSITPSTDQAMIVAIYCATMPASTTTAPSGPGNMTGFNSREGGNTGMSSWCGLAYHEWRTGDGAFDPGACTSSGSNTGDAWIAFTMAFRPA